MSFFFACFIQYISTHSLSPSLIVHSYFLYLYYVPSFLSPSLLSFNFFFSFLFCLLFLFIYTVLLRIKNARSRTFIHLLIIIFHVFFRSLSLAFIDLPRSLFFSSLPALRVRLHICGSWRLCRPNHRSPALPVSTTKNAALFFVLVVTIIISYLVQVY